MWIETIPQSVVPRSFGSGYQERFAAEAGTDQPSVSRFTQMFVVGLFSGQVNRTVSFS